MKRLLFLAAIAAVATPLSAQTAVTRCPPGERLVNGRCLPDPRDDAADGTAADSEPPSRGTAELPSIAPPSPETRGPDSASSGPAAPPGEVRQLRPVRAYLRAADIPPRGFGAYGLVAMRGKPTSESRARLLRACQAFVTHLPPQASLPGNVPLTDQMVTIWPLDAPDAPAAKADNCGFVIDHYDLYGGISAIQDANRQGAKLSGRGPFLVGWSPSSARGVRNKVVLIYDMSAYESQDSFDRAFSFWQDKVISDPKLWRKGWSWQDMRLSIRDFFDSYGEAALKAITLVGNRQ